MLKKSLTFALLVAVSSAHAGTLYNNTDPNGTVNPSSDSNLFSTTFNHVADDFQFGPLGSTFNPASTITGLEFGYQVNSTTTGAFKVKVDFYRDMDITSPSNSGVADIMGGTLVKSYTFSFSGVSQGRYTTGLINLASFGGNVDLPAISDFSTKNHGIALMFYKEDGTTPNGDIRALFQGRQNPTQGYSYDTYAREANNNINGVFAANERNNFGDSTDFKANVYMRLEGTAVPEPTSIAALGLGAVAMLRRRKRA